LAKKYKYLFRFGHGPKPVDLLGPSVTYFWNDIYDLMDMYREMFVEKLNKEIFTFSEIKRIARDLIEDMEEDNAVIWLEIDDGGKRLRFLEIDNLPGYDLDEMQKLLEVYSGEFEQPVIVLSTKETRILHFVEEGTMVLLVHLEDFESGMIDVQMVEKFIAVSKERKAKLLLVSYQKMDDSAAKLVKHSKIAFRKPDEILKKINEQTLEMTLDEFRVDISLEEKVAKFEKGKFCVFLHLVKNASSNIAKKNTLENLAAYLFNSLEGFSVIKRNYRGPSEEIDLLVANESNDVFSASLGTPLVVECRHRKTPASSKDIRDFKGKLEDAGLKSGILITLKGVAGDRYDAVAVIREARKAGMSIVVVSMNDLISIGEGKDPIETIKECFYRHI